MDVITSTSCDGPLCRIIDFRESIIGKLSSSALHCIGKRSPGRELICQFSACWSMISFI